jgi:hypothetical protein
MMKQLAVTILIILGAILTGSSAVAQSGFVSYLPLVVVPPDNFVCETFGEAELCAWVSEGEPARGSTVAVYGRLVVGGVPQAGVVMGSEWRYKTTTVRCDAAVANGEGVAMCERGIGQASVGFRVEVTVEMGGHAVVTGFVPR